MPLLTGQPRVSSARAAWRRRGGSTGPRAQERLGKREREGRRESELRRFGDAARPLGVGRRRGSGLVRPALSRLVGLCRLRLGYAARLLLMDGNVGKEGARLRRTR